jgi:hypothetical protein
MDPAPWVRSGGPWVIRPRPEPLAATPPPGPQAICPKGSDFRRSENHLIRPTSLRPRKPGRWQAAAQIQVASTSQPPGAISRNTLVIDQGTAHHGPRSVGEIRRPRGSSAQGRSLWPVPGSRENPWAFFGYFLSRQKVTPRRGGETRQMAFRTRQECEGETVAWQSKKTALPQSKTLHPGPRGSPFKKRPYGPVLKDR